MEHRLPLLKGIASLMPSSSASHVFFHAPLIACILFLLTSQCYEYKWHPPVFSLGQNHEGPRQKLHQPLYMMVEVV